MTKWRVVRYVIATMALGLAAFVVVLYTYYLGPGMVFGVLVLSDVKHGGLLEYVLVLAFPIAIIRLVLRARARDRVDTSPLRHNLGFLLAIGGVLCAVLLGATSLEESAEYAKYGVYSHASSARVLQVGVKLAELAALVGVLMVTPGTRKSKGAARP